MSTVTLTNQPEVRFPASGVIDVPLRRGINHVLVDVIDSEGNFCLFFLDTGASYSVVTSHFRGRVEPVLSDQDVQQSAVGIDGSLPTAPGTYDVRGLRLGDLTLDRFGAVRMDIPGLDEALGRPVHGILGFNVLRTWLTAIDYRTEKVKIVNPAKREALDGGPPSFLIPFEAHLEAVILIRGLINGARTNFVLDIGCSTTLLNSAAGKASQIEFEVKGGASRKGGEESDATPAGIAESVVLGPLALVRQKVWMLDIPPFAALGLDEQPAAILGNDLLDRFRVLIDYERQELSLWNGH